MDTQRRSKIISTVFLFSLLVWPVAFVVSGMIGGHDDSSRVNLFYYTVLLYPVTVLVSFFLAFLLRKKNMPKGALCVSFVPTVHVLFGAVVFTYILLVPQKIADSDTVMCSYIRGLMPAQDNRTVTKLSCNTPIGPLYEDSSIVVKSGALAFIPHTGSSPKGIISTFVLWDIHLRDIEIKDDINFDGYLDMRLIDNRGARNFSYTYYMFDPQEGTFKQDIVLTNLPFPEFDKGKKVIRTNPVDDQQELYVFAGGSYKLQK